MRKIVEGMALAAALGAASPEVVAKERAVQQRVENSMPADLRTSQNFLLAIAGISKKIESSSVIKQEKELLKKRIEQLIDENERIHTTLRTRDLPQAEKNKLLEELNSLIQDFGAIKQFIDSKNN